MLSVVTCQKLISFVIRKIVHHHQQPACSEQFTSVDNTVITLIDPFCDQLVVCSRRRKDVVKPREWRKRKTKTRQTDRSFFTRVETKTDWSVYILFSYVFLALVWQPFGHIFFIFRHFYCSDLENESKYFDSNQKENVPSVQKKKDKERSSLHEFGLDAVSSAVATAIARSVVAPFDRVKIISQVHYTSIVNCPNNQHYHPGILTTLNQIYREQGLRALWFGNFTNILRFVPSQATMFGLNTFYLKLFLSNIKHKDDGWSHTTLSLISGGLSGATTLCMFYPLLFCQTHLAAHVGPLVDREYTGLLDCIQKTVHTNGVRALYTGFAIAANGMVINKAIYFGAYYSFNKTILDHSNSLVSIDEKDIKLPFWIRFGTAQVSTYLSQLFSYPLDTIGRMLIVQTAQEEKLYLNARDCFTKLWKSQGVTGLYRGMLPNMIRSSGSALILVLHDEFKWILSKMGLFGGEIQDD